MKIFLGLVILSLIITSCSLDRDIYKQAEGQSLSQYLDRIDAEADFQLALANLHIGNYEAALKNFQRINKDTLPSDPARKKLDWYISGLLEVVQKKKEKKKEKEKEKISVYTDRAANMNKMLTDEEIQYVRWAVIYLLEDKELQKAFKKFIKGDDYSETDK